MNRCFPAISSHLVRLVVGFSRASGALAYFMAFQRGNQEETMSTLLVIDDDRLHCDLLEFAFARQGYQVSTATNGRAGVALFRQLRPLVTLIDLRMPEMDGLAVLQEIRMYAPCAGVLILGGGATEEQENQARQLRVTDFLRKGLSLDVLIGSVHRIAQQSRRHASSPPSSPDEETDQVPSEKILVVDDDVMARDLLVRFLSLRGYHVRSAKDGSEALRLNQLCQIAHVPYKA